MQKRRATISRVRRCNSIYYNDIIIKLLPWRRASVAAARRSGGILEGACVQEADEDTASAQNSARYILYHRYADAHDIGLRPIQTAGPESDFASGHVTPSCMMLLITAGSSSQLLSLCGAFRSIFSLLLSLPLLLFMLRRSGVCNNNPSLLYGVYVGALLKQAGQFNPPRFCEKCPAPGARHCPRRCQRPDRMNRPKPNTPLLGPMEIRSRAGDNTKNDSRHYVYIFPTISPFKSI